MTDIDFDELDKAVNSLMGDKAVPQPKPEQSASETPDVPEPGPRPAAEPESVVPTMPLETSPLAAPSASPVRPASLATKRRGQFMDVMHPSANMATASTRAPGGASRVSRKGVTLTPSGSDVTAEPASPLTPTPTPVVAPPATPEWPDPIDLATEKMAATQELESLEPVASAEPTPTDSPVEPLSSPFLPDAKVEKRPLGGVPTAEEPSESLPPAEPTPLPDETAPLPDELSGRVLAVESNEVAVADKPVAPVAPVEQSKPEVVEPVAADAPVASPAPVAEEAAKPASGPTSIPPQYKAGQADKPAEHSALYDSVSETHATATPTKKKSGWLIPLAVVGLIILGCVGGVAAYYYFL